MIALVGNPFSPAYARARAKGGGGEASPLEFCAMNVAVYGPRGSAWALREQPISPSARSEHGVQIGLSTMQWVGDELRVDIRERTTPFGRPLRGAITLRPDAMAAATYALDREGRHTWRPVAPSARALVRMDEPALRFEGHGYHDTNRGAAPLDAGIRDWTWSRASVGRGRTLVTYDVTQSDGARLSLGLDLGEGGARPLEAPSFSPLATTAWRLRRRARSEPGSRASVARELEDTPFYARALVRTRLQGRDVVAVHETLSVERLQRAWVRFLLGFRMGKG